MNIEETLMNAAANNIIYLLLAVFVVVVILKGIRIVPQSEKYVVERRRAIDLRCN